MSTLEINLHKHTILLRNKSSGKYLSEENRQSMHPIQGHSQARLIPPQNVQTCDEFGGVTNKKGNLTPAVSWECPGDSDQLVASV